MYSTTISLISTCPSSRRYTTGRGYLEQVINVSQWAENDGWDAILVYTSNSLTDPWSLAQYIIQNTVQLKPLVAVQPFYAHPFTVAKIVATLGFLFERQVYLNMVAGDFPRDREALCDAANHDVRYARLIEYTTIIKTLLSTRKPLSFSGNFFHVELLQLFPAIPKELIPLFTISGSSQAGLQAARSVGAAPIQYPKPSFFYKDHLHRPDQGAGMRVGIIAKDTDSAAWDVARLRFPPSIAGADARALATQASDSSWVKNMAADITVPDGHPYWLSPYHNYQSSCPFLVGSKLSIIKEIVSYLKIGFRLFLVESPTNKADSEMIGDIFKRAQNQFLADQNNNPT